MWTWTERHGTAAPSRGGGAPRRIVAVALGLLMPFGAGGCRQDMHDAPSYSPLEGSGFFDDGTSARTPVPGTVARGHLYDDTLVHTGKDGADFSPVFPFPITATDLDRGQERYDVFCSPCHDRTGGGNGMVIQRGFRRRPPSFHDERLRAVPPGYLYDVIRNGFGAMQDYAAQVPVDDRWRIVAYVRALQLSQHAAPADVPVAERGALVAGGAE